MVETIYLNLCQLSGCLAISHISKHMFDDSYFSGVFFSFKIILLFNIIDFLKQKLSMTKIMYMYVLEARCITLHSRSEIYRDGLNRC